MKKNPISKVPPFVFFAVGALAALAACTPKQPVGGSAQQGDQTTLQPGGGQNSNQNQNQTGGGQQPGTAKASPTPGEAGGSAGN